MLNRYNVEIEMKERFIEQALEHKKKYLEKFSSDDVIVKYTYEQFLKDNKKKDSEYPKQIFFEYIDNTNNDINGDNESSINKYDVDNVNYINNKSNKDNDSISKLIDDLSKKRNQINSITSLIDLLSNNDIEEVVFKSVKSKGSDVLFNSIIIEKVKNITLSELKGNLIGLNIEVKDMLKEAYGS